jgi:dGTPase
MLASRPGGVDADAGGFEHNNQSLRVVDYLEHPYPQFRGLNLTFETREGLVKHFTTYDKPLVGLLPAEVRSSCTGRWPTPGWQIACISDRLAYDVTIWRLSLPHR